MAGFSSLKTEKYANDFHKYGIVKNKFNVLEAHKIL